MSLFKKIVKKRLPALEPGVLENNFVRASEFNTVIDDLNSKKTGQVVSATGSNTPTINAVLGKFTSATLTTAANTAATLTVSNNLVTANSMVTAEIINYSGTLVNNGIPQRVKVVPGSGTITITIVNTHASNALNGTVTIQFMVLD
jgi:hypothetical protein